MINRRELLGAGVGFVGSMIIPKVGMANACVEDQPNKIQYAAFIKFVQSLNYDELAERIAEMGYQGIEATIRKKGYIEPEKAVDELPKLVASLNKCGLKILVMTTDVNSINDKVNLNLLKVASKLGIKQYRMGYYNYDLKSSSPPLIKQLEEFKPMVKELAAFNHDTEIQGLYQNHTGAKVVGSTVWDLRELLAGISPLDIGVAFDIRHAAATSGQSWPVSWNVMQEHLGCIYVKDCKWENNKLENTPLGLGIVDRKFFEDVKRLKYQGTISIHVEYLEKGSVKENLAAMNADLMTLKKWME